MIPAVDTRSEYDGLASTYLPIAVAVYVLVALAVGWALLRGRRRASPSRRRGNMPLELAYIGGLVAVAVVLLTLTFSTEGRIDEPQARAVERVRVVAARWHWSFEYPGRGIAVRGTDDRPATLVVPRGRPVAFEGRSEDVIHGFWIPALRFQRQLFNDRTTRWQLTFRGTETGSAAPCSFFCGLEHQRMRFRIRVLAPADYEAWARRETAG